MPLYIRPEIENRKPIRHINNSIFGSVCVVKRRQTTYDIQQELRTRILIVEFAIPRSRSVRHV